MTSLEEAPALDVRSWVVRAIRNETAGSLLFQNKRNSPPDSTLICDGKSVDLTLTTRKLLNSLN